MQNPLLTSMRCSTPFMRTVSAAVAIIFTMFIMTPAAMAARQEIEKVQTTINSSDDTKLSKAIQKTQEHINKLSDKLGSKQDASHEKNALKQLRKDIIQLDKAAVTNFAKMEKHIKKHKLSAVILERHADALASYQNDMAQLLQNLEDIETATDDTSRKAKVKKAKDHLSSKQHKGSQHPFDPNNLPNHSPEGDPNNTPKLNKKDFNTAGLFDTPNVKLAALGDFTYDKLIGASDPGYLAATSEVTLSAAIQAKAAELNYDAVEIYHWVRNNIHWQPTWGAMQDADLTLASQRGNAMDIASLTIALLRASQIPARYVHGTIEVPKDRFMNWAGGFTRIESALQYASSGGIPSAGVITGGEVTKVQMEHVWVEAATDFNPSMGAVNKDADSWIQIDPSYKQYTYQQGLDAVAISGIDTDQLAQDFANSGTTNETEGWVTGLDSTLLDNAQTQSQAALEQYITDNLTNPTIGDVIGGPSTIIQDYPILPMALDNKILVKGARYSEIPVSLQHQMTFSFGNHISVIDVAPLTYPWAELNNQKVTLSFKPATPDDEAALQSLLPEGEITDLSQLPDTIPGYLVNVIPELAINGQVVKTGEAMQLGQELPLSYSINRTSYGSQSYQSPVAAGSYLSIAVVGGSVSPTLLTNLQTQIDTTKTILESSDPNQIGNLTREDLLGDMFYAGTLGYFAQFTAISHLSAQTQNAHVNLYPSTGTYGYVPEVDYLFGLPKGIRSGGVQMDLDSVSSVNTTDAGDQVSRINFRYQLGILSSALEHAIPEQMFVTTENPGEAVSAVKALQKAAAAGQRIYHITQENMATALPAIHHEQSTMDEIQYALNTGKEVITHTDSISVPGWTGEGYIIFDPETGDGAYKIGGGANGAWIILALIATALIFLSLLPFVLVGGLAVLAASAIPILVSIGLYLYAGYQMTKDWTAEEWSGFAEYVKPLFIASLMLRGILIAAEVLNLTALYIASGIWFILTKLTGDTLTSQGQ